jgi:hypothetical protein
MDVIVPLTEGPMPFGFGKRYEVFAAPLRDFGGVPRSWRRFLEQVIEELEQGKNLLAFCGAGHGRTGTFLASLIALLESADETPDPIAAVRERYCDLAVETLAQAEGIFNLRHETVPGQYQREFARPLWGTLFSSLDPLRLDLLLGRQPRHQGDDKKK